MRNKLVRFISGVLLAAMIVVSNVPADTVLAAGENTSVMDSTDEEEAIEKENSEQDFEASVQTESQNSDAELSDVGVENEKNNMDNSVPSSSSAVTGSENVEDAEQGTEKSLSNEEISVGNINFVYIESPYLETPSTQRIVLFFDKEIVGAETIALTVSDMAGNQEEWPLSKQEGNLYLFEKNYIDETYTNTYKAVCLKLQGKDSEKILDLAEMNVDAEFGVNEEYEGIDELQVLDGTDIYDETDIETSIVTIDENRITEAQDDIASALQSVAEEGKQNTVNLFSRAAASQTKTSGEIVVALDPGHDYNDAGAQGYGLREEELTLKIANYCKEELEKYAGISVFMTRTSNTCPYNCTSASGCIQARVNAAKSAGADIFVSFHLNAADAASANGAEVIIPNKNWKPELAEEGQELAEEILNQLVKLGLTRRSIYSRDSLSGTKYTDGSIADYFAVPRMCKQAGFTGIIVEHAFITNSGDVNRFLKTEAGLKKLGVADAAGIVQYYGLRVNSWTKPALQTPSATYQGTKISWNSVNEATGYAVYRKSDTEGWKMIDTTTATSYVDSSVLSNGKTYYYTVRAYKGTEEVAFANKYDTDYWTSYDFNGVQAVYMTMPIISGTTTADSGIKLSWNAVSGVKGYAVYRKTAGTGWGLLGTTSSTSYTDKTGLNNGTEYYYTLRAYTGSQDTALNNKYNARYWSAYDNSGIKGKYISTPVLSGASASATGTTVSWKAVNGASGYAIYRKVSGGSWATIATTTSVSYTDTSDLVNGDTYYYTVRAYTGNVNTATANKYDSNYWSYFNPTGVKSIYIDTPTLLATTTAQSGIKINWEAVSGASGYAVYRKMASTGWGMIATTTSTSYTDKSGMSNGATYYYTIRAYKGDVNTAKKNKYSADYWSGYDTSGVQGKYLSTPVLTGEKASANGRTISWNAVSGATGYAVYRKVSGGSWATIDTTASTNYTDTSNLSNGKTYYYTVRAYVSNADDDAAKNRYDSNYWSYYDTVGLRTVYTPSPLLNTAVKVDSGIKVTWSAVNGATGYAVYRKAPGGSWGMIGTTTSVSYIDKTSGSAVYYYTVRAYRSSLTGATSNKYSAVYWSGYDNVGVKISDLTTPVLESAKVVNDGLQISWNMVNGASGYAVYRKTANTGWGMIGTSTSQAYIDKNAGSSGTVYYYTVRAFRGDDATALSNKYKNDYWSYYDTNGVCGSAYEIEGDSTVTVEQMVKFYNTYSPISYPSEALKSGGASNITELAQIFYEEASDEGIKPEVVWCQTMLETGFLKFDGDVDISQFNFAGIGAVGNAVAGASFSTVRDGVRAQVQHMKAYASASVTSASLKHPLIDPRFDLVSKGSAKYVEILGIQENPLGCGWASGAGYGTEMVKLVLQLKTL